jgi:AcrR family transcriptional regulator
MLEILTADPLQDLDGPTIEILDAALAEFTQFGIRRTSIAEIAKRAGIHRATVYRRFPSKDELVMAAAILWTRRFFSEITRAVAHLGSVDDRLVEGFTVAYPAIRTDPFVTRILTTDREIALPFLTVDGGPVIATLRDFLVTQARAAGEDRDDLIATAELATRIGLSLLLTPETHFHLDTEEQRRAFARRYLVHPATRSIDQAPQESE